jgi:hypothetical protein
MRSRKRLIAPSSFLVAALAAGAAEAAPPSAGAGPARSSAQFTLHRDEAGGPDAITARQRARAGDCAGALPAFDAAIRVTIEPTLRRDRGLCHEKLADPFPAIDDYRAYLTARADAPDADQIRDRLARLEEQVGVGGRSAEAVRESEDTTITTSGGGTISLGAGSSSSSSSSSSRRSASRDAALGPRPGEQGKSYDYYASEERIADQADTSPLRFGKGFMIGAFLTIPRYFFSDYVSSDMGYALGAAIRYAWAPELTFISELGFSGFGTSGAASSASGPLVFAGVEYRIPLNKWAGDQLLLGAGPGFQRFTVSGSKAALNAWEGRARFGYRHVFGSAVALEGSVDGGPAFVQATGSGTSSDGKVVGLFGTSFAFVVGF